jgi:hypothetical protein
MAPERTCDDGMTAVVPFFVLSLLSPGTGAAQTARTDPLCAPLLAFAASVQPGQSRAIELRTGWGGDVEGVDHPVIAGSACAHAHADDVGKAVCTALSQHGNTERPDLNASRALACLAPGTWHPFRASTDANPTRRNTH